MRRVGIIGVAVGQPELIRGAIYRIPSAAMSSDFYEAKRHHLPYARSYRMPVDAETVEVIKRHRQLSVLGAAVVAQLDLNPIQYPTR
jgi:hypothetical protein